MISNKDQNFKIKIKNFAIYIEPTIRFHHHLKMLFLSSLLLACNFLALIQAKSLEPNDPFDLSRIGRCTTVNRYASDFNPINLPSGTHLVLYSDNNCSNEIRIIDENFSELVRTHALSNPKVYSTKLQNGQARNINDPIARPRVRAHFQ